MVMPKTINQVSDQQEGLPRRQRRWAVLATSLGTMMSMVDQTIANTALPTIAHDVHASAASSIWVINAYQLAVTMLLVPFASLGDIIGYAKLYRACLAIFVAASLGCALSHTLLALTLARVAQGIGAAGLTVTSAPLNRLAFPPSMLGRAVGYAAMVVALGAAAGPIIGGAILAFAPWPWLFAINVPIGLVALALATRSLANNSGHGGSFDWFSAIFSAATFGLGILAFDGLGHGAPPATIIAEFAVAAVVATIFIRRQLALPMPMFAVDLLARSQALSLAVVSCFTSFVAQMIAYVALPFGFHTIMGRTPLEIGFLMLPWLLAAAAVAPLAGRLADRYDSATLSAVGLGTFSLGLALLAFEPSHAAMADVMWRMLVCGIGYGFYQSPNNRAIQSQAPRNRSGAAQSLQATARLSGQTVGATCVALVFVMFYDRHSSNGVGPTAIFVAMLIAVGFGLIATLASVVRRASSAVVQGAAA